MVSDVVCLVDGELVGLAVCELVGLAIRARGLGVYELVAWLVVGLVVPDVVVGLVVPDVVGESLALAVGRAVCELVGSVNAACEPVASAGRLEREPGQAWGPERPTWRHLSP